MAVDLRSPALVGVLALAALLLAAAAILLLGPASSVVGPGASSGSGTGSGQLNIVLPAWVWGILFLSPLLVGITALVYRRLVEGHGTRAWGILLGLVVLLVLYYLLQAGSGAGGFIGVSPGGGTNPGGNHSSNNTSGGGGGTGTGGSGGPGAASFHFALPPYIVYVVAAAICAVVLAVAVPGVVARLTSRRPKERGEGGARAEREEVASAMGAAARALEQGADPKETIVRLYLQLLVRVSTLAGETTFETAEEIRQLHLAPLGVPSDIATTLTRLFEEARYSSHAMDPAAVVRAQGALRSAELALRAPALPTA